MNFNVLISDGQWRSHSSAMAVVRNMKNNTNLKVKTFSVGLAINTGNRRNYDDLAKAGGTEKALYANSANELLQVLKDAILQAISGNLTFTTPAVMSELQKGNFIYQSTFKYEKHKQWEGSLKKYRLKNDGTFDTLQWDAATKLNSKSPGARNIWTAGIGVKNLNNITTSNRAVLKSALFPNKTNPTDTETDDLINFIRGFDSYDTDSDGKTDDTRHKLADIYNSELVVVGSPEASITDTGELNFSKTDNYYRQQNKYVDFRAGNSCGGSCSNRTEVVLAGANSGLLHAFKSLDGEELWSYIPPNIIGKISSIVTVRSNSTNPIYGVDGSPIVKDVIFDDTPNNGINDPRWRTVLMSGLGSGGHGYFALDITDINNPKHLFTIENDTYNKIINFWDIDENKNSFSYAAGSTVPEQYDYSKLGATWSQPRIIRLKIDGKDKWVAITGGGYNNAVSPDYGSNIYVIDISNGKVLKEIEISDNRIGYHAYSFGIPAGTKEFNVAPFGLTSYNTNLQKLIIEGPGGLGWGLTQNVDSSGVATNIKVVLDDITPVNLNFLITKVNKNDIVNSVPADLTVITADGSRFADYEGAMVYVPDLEGKITKINLTGNFTTTNNIISSSINKSTFFDAQANTDNGRYNYNELEATVNNDNNLWLYFGTGNSQKLQDQSSNIKNRVFGLMDKDFPNYSTKSFTYSNCSNNGCPSTTQVGWYLDLVKAQKITAKATIDKDRVYFPVYEPTNQANACKTGKAILQAYDSKCGKRLMNVEVGSGVLSEVVIMGDNLYVGLSGTANTNIQGFESKDNLITTKSKATASGKEVQIMKWKENY